MRHAHFECVGGASGDMILGGLLELGASLTELKAALSSLSVGAFDFDVSRGESKHIQGLRLKVVIAGHPEAARPAEPMDHHQAIADHHHPHDHDHRPLSEIEAMIGNSALPGPVKHDSVSVFRALGRAEANIHGVPVEQIHFHEVGADDSMIDLVGSCWARHQLEIASVSVGAIPLGQGVIRCAHGVYPNPAPATQELLTGFTVTQTDEPFELVTPTGAALLSTWRNSTSIPNGARLIKTAYSLGTRQLLHRPNLLRISLYETEGDHADHDVCLMLECNLDDTTPEIMGVLVDEVLAAGALDAGCTPVTMKKQRPGVVFFALVEPSAREGVLNAIFRGSTTFGVREYPVARTKLVRRFNSVDTPYGPIKIKIGTWQGEDIVHAPEMEDCRRMARDKKLPVRVVYEAAQRASRKGV